MSKKEKNIEVNVTDETRNGQPVQQVFIGTKLIGEVVSGDDRFVASMAVNNQQFIVRSQEEGLAIILQQYHLHQN